MTKLTGSCLCGSVSYVADGDIKLTMNCHCTSCQTLTGSVYGTNLFFAEGDLAISGELATYQHKSDSGNTMTRYFCPNCGTQIYGTNSGREGMVTLRAGGVHQKDEIKPSINIYCDSAVPSTAMDSNLKTFAKMPT